ncbi:BglG family transcription antiterminator [Halanaerobium congolense]|jgi:transcriptional antiterminator|uniref:BglG family transcription antiterminator n=1 Tax=Halanaerobium congolense TaxID=54121 RepID=UPI00087F3045|nr:BglG family transcription antiterminator [Halanaerobium congolense]SDH85967.1 Transcriptional antiterminator [Halanaerobium congolense]SDK85314.1 Transcriptional antiterminator [Halanaerobium congolense]SDM64446.1 Transcriptional antiterminator [Halanaerobium congolense]
MLALPNKRCGKILSILLKINESITIKDLASQFDISARTIRNDLNQLEIWLKERSIELVKKPGVGIWLNIKSDSRRNLLTKISKLERYKDPISPEKRKEFILKYLLYQDDKYTMQNLADNLFVSRSTIYKDLDQIEKWLKKYNLSLERKQNYGIYVKGAEKDWRKAVADLLVKLKNNEELKNMLENELDKESSSRNSRKDIYHQLEGLFGDVNFEEVERIIQEVEIESEFIFTDEAITALVIHIAIALERLDKNKDIKMKNEQLNVLKDKKEFALATKIAEKIQTRLSYQLPKAEIGYISLHILGSKLQQHLEKKDVEKVIKNSEIKTVEAAQKIIKMSEEILGYNFKTDEELLLGLILHLRTAINRLKYGLSIRNPILSEIKENYPTIFGAAWSSSIIFQEDLNLKVNEDEIGYIALHLGAAVERITKSWKVIIVCSSGVGTSQLLASKIKKYLPRIEIIEILSTHELDNKDLNNVDLVISTIPLSNIKKDVITVSPILSESDLSRINEKINYSSQANKSKFNNRMSPAGELKNLFESELIFANLDLESPKEVIEFLGGKLQKRGFVDQKFIDSVLEREKITATEVGKGLAIPHARINDVKQRKVAVAVLNEAIQWGEEKVKVVFLLAIDSQIARKFFSYFYQIMEDELFLNELKEAKTKEKVISLLTKRGL